jgi:predicted outer membrane protein
MTARKTSWILAAAAGLAIGSGGFAFSAGAEPQNDAPAAAQQAGQSDARDQGAQGGARADEQIDHLIAQIAADPKTAADKLFLLTAAIHNQAEIALAKEVLQKSQNEHVQKLAHRIIEEREKTRQQLQQTAQALGMQLPEQLAQRAVAAVHIVAALPADQIDRQYTAQAQADNAQDLSEYQSEAQIAQDPAVRGFAHNQVDGMRSSGRDADETAQTMGMRDQNEAQPAAGTVQGRTQGQSQENK